MKGRIHMSEKKEQKEFTLTDEKMDYLFKESVRLELEREKILGIKTEEDEKGTKWVNVYA